MNSMSIVVCTYTEDRWETLRRAIDVILKQIDFNDELLIVVDHNELLLERCRDAFDNCVVIANRHRRGLSGARNTALEKARGSIIAFLDDDAVPIDGWLDALRTSYADERVYGVGGHAKPRWQNGRPAWFPDEFLWVVGCSYRGLPTVEEPVRNLVGVNMSFRRIAFDHVGGFVEAMGRLGDRPLGCEETEFCIRLTRTNPDAMLVYNPSAQVEHDVPEKRESIRYFARRCWAEGLSKAQVSRRVGRSSALSAERHYASRVLPGGIWQGLRDMGAGDIWGAARSGAIALGFAVTTAGYCIGGLRRSEQS
jgi:glycosyltransferase involved in cell wall biosynthesis